VSRSGDQTCVSGHQFLLIIKPEFQIFPKSRRIRKISSLELKTTVCRLNRTIYMKRAELYSLAVISMITSWHCIKALKLRQCPSISPVNDMSFMVVL